MKRIFDHCDNMNQFCSRVGYLRSLVSFIFLSRSAKYKYIFWKDLSNNNQFFTRMKIIKKKNEKHVKFSVFILRWPIFLNGVYGYLWGYSQNYMYIYIYILQYITNYLYSWKTFKPVWYEVYNAAREVIV